MKPIRYELEIFFESLGNWMTTTWPRQEKEGDPETRDDALSRLHEKQMRNPNVRYRMIKVTREVVR